ncbi:MAG: hypothetical protein D9V45_03030 [Chloroflexi bacterium]|nr:MAG: hypothetical protein D9V45_03030 [Chloroflexota bacterium]
MNQDEQAERMKGNQSAVKHGAEGALRRRNEGKPFIGLAAEEEKAVLADLQEMGIAELVKRDAIRLQTITNLYYAAVQKAAETGDIMAFDRYVARLGWLAGVTLRAWQQVTNDQKDAAKSAAGIVDVMTAIRKARDDKRDK